MAYVALSRVYSLSGLYLAAFDPKSIMVNHSCLKEVNRLREAYKNDLPQYPVPLQTRTKRKLTGSTQDDQPKANWIRKRRGVVAVATVASLMRPHGDIIQLI